MVPPHSFSSRTCRCRPGRLANTWPPAREPPACQDSLKVCVSNPAGPAGQERRWLGRLQAGPCAAWSEDLGPPPQLGKCWNLKESFHILEMLSTCGKQVVLGISGTQVPLGIWVFPGQPHSRAGCGHWLAVNRVNPHTLGLRYENGSLVMPLRGPVLERERSE